MGGLAFEPEEATAHLSRADRRLAGLIEQAGPLRLEIEHRSTAFQAIAESILHQQLTASAAATILKRLKGLYPGRSFPSPQAVIETPDEALRAAGLSGMKAAALKDLAAKTLSGTVPPLKTMKTMPDEAIIESLCCVRGVGRWTAEMLLIFRLGRQDVMPASDYGIRNGYALTYRTGDLPAAGEILAFSERWRPFRTAASWYLWRAVDLARSARK